MLDKVANIFTKANEPDHGYIVQPVTFLPLDIDAIKRGLGIEELAVVRGQNELPKADIGSLDEVERKIAGDIEGRRKKAADDADGGLKGYTMRINSIDFYSQAQSMRALARKAESDFRTTMQHAVDELGQLKKERDRAEADLHTFRQTNRLSREARLPHWPTWVSSCFLFAVFAVEFLANGVFFAEHVEGGLIQGMGEAILFALLNVFWGFVAGRLATHLLHVNRTRKLLAAATLLFVAVILIGNNLLAAHYRGVLGSDADVEHPAIVAWEHFKMTPLGIDDVKGWVLMGFGFMCAFASGAKAWKWDDPYPGYGAIFHARQAAVDAFLIRKKELMNALTKARDVASKDMKASTRFLDRSLQHYRHLLETRKQCFQAFISYLDDLERGANDLLMIYRQKNSETRKTPGPPHFRTPYSLSRPTLTPPPDHAEDTAKLGELVKEVTAEMTAKEHAVHDAHDEAVSNIGQIE